MFFGVGILILSSFINDVFSNYILVYSTTSPIEVDSMLGFIHKISLKFYFVVRIPLGPIEMDSLELFNAFIPLEVASNVEFARVFT